MQKNNDIEEIKKDAAARSSVKTNSPTLNTPQAADYLGLKPGTLEVWRWRGEGPRFLKLGRACRYRKADLDEFMRAAERESTSSDSA